MTIGASGLWLIFGWAAPDYRVSVMRVLCDEAGEASKNFKIAFVLTMKIIKNITVSIHFFFRP
jgi:hypothetical protein